MALELSRPTVQSAITNVKSTIDEMDGCIGNIDSFLNGTMYSLWNTPKAHDEFAVPLKNCISDFVGQFNTIFNGVANEFIETCNNTAFIPENIPPIEDRCDKNLRDVTVGWEGQENDFNVEPSFSTEFDNCRDDIKKFSADIDSVKSFLSDAFSSGLASSFGGEALSRFDSTAESAKEVLAKYETNFYAESLENDRSLKNRMSS